MADGQAIRGLDTTLAIEPITPLLGAEISGLDLRQELSAATVDGLRAALLRHKLLVFRDQAIDDAQQLRLTRYFGRVTPAHPITDGTAREPAILENVLSRGRGRFSSIDPNLEHPLRPAQRPRGRAGWHIDITFVANPNSVTLLRGLEIPAVGGDTLFVNLEALYEGLSPTLQAFLDGLQAIHVRDDAADGHAPPPRRDGRTPGPFAAVHALVRVHPETQKKILFLAPSWIRTLLLDFLTEELVARADLQARVRWRPNTLVIWDNRAVAHAGPVDPRWIDGERIVRRTTVEGDIPIGANGFVSRALVGEHFNTLEG
jgi:alpha-ketoglutarate-dependent taurine dioxygenase